MKVAEIRSKFLDFFSQRGHTIVPSSSLVPANDPTLMFVNSGMVQFKDVFLGTDQRPYKRAISVQACLRAGGKHNDLENVGYTARHHTFFEMLGNWSFGDYFKKEAILWSWELLTQTYKIPAEKLLATVYAEDDEAYDIWANDVGLPPERIIRIGDNKGARYASDNFWMMADTGPCGPCSEIFYDHGADIPGGPPGSPDEDGDRFIEIWNIVFMQFDMKEDGSVTKLPSPCVDTGMGLERLAAILQGVHSNYEIDLFAHLVKAAAKATQTEDLKNPSLRVIADHIRACSFLIADGVLPSNEGRGHVLRRIIRRAIRHGYKLDCREPFFYKLVPTLVKEMGEAYPSLAKQEYRISDVLGAEESRFFETLVDGMEILEAELAKGKKELPGEVAFKLHDTYGFPLDLTADVCRERDIKVDEAGFNAAMTQQKERGRASSKFKMDKILDYSGAPTQFQGYERISLEGAIITALYLNGEPVDAVEAGQDAVVVLDRTPFYAESGGQVGDQGILRSEASHSLFNVSDTQKIHTNVFGHHGHLERGVLRVGETLEAMVNEIKHGLIAANHSATHLLHKALRDMLGEHVQQKGSLVDPDKLRFDFSHDFSLTRQQIIDIENQVNSQILENHDTYAQEMSLEDAQKTGAMMLFGEKYGEQVRVLQIGSSTELCGGTHVPYTGNIGLFKITSESGIAAGVRRIEAVTGVYALKYMRSMEETVLQLAQILRTPAVDLQQKIVNTLEELREAERELSALKSRLAASQGDGLASQAKDINGVKVLTAVMKGAEAKALREAIDQLKGKLGSAIIVLASTEGEKVQLAAAVTPDLIAKVKAGDLVNMVAQQVGGKGGGKPDMAMAGGTDPSRLGSALQSVEPWLKERL
ncbi:MAG: alanine--tRNA ligase [Saezia sp.]